MAFSDLGNNLLADITGSAEKAIIRICDETLNGDLHKDDGVATKAGSPALGAFGGIAGSAAAEKMNAMASEASKMATDAAAKEVQNLALSKLKSALDIKEFDYNRQFQVQFNPNTMALSSRKYDKDDLSCIDGSQNDLQINQPSGYPDMTFSVTLQFENVAPARAFYSDLVGSTGNVSKVVRGAANLVKDTLLGGTFKSVQSITEAFVGAIRNAKRRRICFEWNNLCYEGLLNSVRTKYTMFDLLGKPIRSEVAIMIRLSDMSLNSTNMGYWQDAYDAAFGFDELTGGWYGTAKSEVKKAGSVAGGVIRGAEALAVISSQMVGYAGLADEISETLKGDARRKAEDAEAKAAWKEQKDKDDEARKAAREKAISRSGKARVAKSGQENKTVAKMDEDLRDGQALSNKKAAENDKNNRDFSFDIPDPTADEPGIENAQSGNGGTNNGTPTVGNINAALNQPGAVGGIPVAASANNSGVPGGTLGNLF